jgi:hypothetical protein
MFSLAKGYAIAFWGFCLLTTGLIWGYRIDTFWPDSKRDVGIIVAWCAMVIGGIILAIGLWAYKKFLCANRKRGG